MTLQDQLRKHVRAAGIQETARRTGIGAGHLSAWCNGARGLSSENLERVIAALELRVEIRQ